MTNIVDILAMIKENNRVCPNPLMWQKLYDMLPNKKLIKSDWQPPLPLILTAWHYSNDDQKSLRLSEHIEWSDKNGCIEKICQFLSSLSEDDWHHIGD